MKKALVTYSILGLVTYILVFLLIRPGYLELFSPVHSDIFRYYVIGNQEWLLESWKSPRPLMLMYLHLITFTKSWYLFVILLSLPSLVLVILLGAFISSKFETRPSIFASIIYFVLIYSSPLFLPMYQYDIGGMLSGIVILVLVMLIFKNSFKNKVEIHYFFFVFMLSFIAVEFKQTFAATAIVLGLIFLIAYRTKPSLYTLFLILFSISISLIKDKLFNSSFIRTDVDNNVYSVIISPLKNLELLNFYIAHSFTMGMVFVFLISCFVLYKKYFKEVFIITILAISASAPMALLLNREWPIYSLYSMIIFSSLIQLSAIKIRDLDNRYIKLLISVLFVVLTILHAYTPSTETNWNIKQQNYNKNVLQAVDNIKNNIIGKKILFVGLEGPYHPFKSKEFIQEYTNNKITNFDVLLYENESDWNEMSKNDQPNGIYEKDLNLTIYDDLVMFNADGTISNIYLPAQLNLLKYSDLNKKLFLKCNFLPTQENILAVDEKKLLGLMECLNIRLDFQSTIEISENGYFDINITNPWEFYHLAKAYKNLGNQNEAIREVDRAIKVEPKNQTFENLKLEIYKDKRAN